MSEHTTCKERMNRKELERFQRLLDEVRSSVEQAVREAEDLLWKGVAELSNQPAAVSGWDREHNSNIGPVTHN